MRCIRKLVGLMFLLAVFSIMGCSQKPVELRPPPVVENPKVSLETQLETFRSLGFTLNNGVSMAELETPENRTAFEKKPYSLMYIELGRTIEREPWTPLTDRCWDFDTEAIEDHGSYVEILKNLQRISRGVIKFENLRDYVDVEKQIAWVSFSFKGKQYKWNLKVEDDWVDEQIFSKIVALLRQSNVVGRYTYFDTGGQNAVIGFETPVDLEKLKKATGLKIEWLD